jgi:hypothetical protein
MLVKQNNDDTDREISNYECEDLGLCTFSSDIEEDDLDHWEEVLYLDQARRDMTMPTTSVPLPKKRSCADTVIARTPLPVGAITPPLVKHQKSAIDISRESDVVQTLPLPKAGGDHNVHQPKAVGDRNIRI